MELLFNFAELDVFRRESLQKIFDVLSLEGGCEIVVRAIRLPDEFQINIDRGLNGCGFDIVWADEKLNFYFASEIMKEMLALVLSERTSSMLSELLER